MNISSCPYCNSKVTLESSVKVYGKDYGLIYLCTQFPKCDSYVGTHKGTTKPLGRLADKQLRRYKNMAHSIFDHLWKTNKKFTRSQAYHWLSEQLQISGKDCHIGMFDIDMCKKVIEVCKKYYGVA